MTTTVDTAGDAWERRLFSTYGVLAIHDATGGVECDKLAAFTLATGNHGIASAGTPQSSDSILKGKSNARVFSPESRRSEGERRSGKRDIVRRVAQHTIGDRQPSFQSFSPPHVRTAVISFVVVRLLRSDRRLVDTQLCAERCQVLRAHTVAPKPVAAFVVKALGQHVAKKALQERHTG